MIHLRKESKISVCFHDKSFEEFLLKVIIWDDEIDEPLMTIEEAITKKKITYKQFTEIIMKTNLEFTYQINEFFDRKTRNKN